MFEFPCCVRETLTYAYQESLRIADASFYTHTRTRSGFEPPTDWIT